MANIDKLVTYAELKLGQFGVDYREHHEEDEIQEVEPKAFTASGNTIQVDYDARSYTIDLANSGVSGDITPEDTALVTDRLKEFFNKK